jgi:hypothetical protein
MMLDAAAKFDVVFMRLKETNPRYLSYFEVDSKGKKNLGPPVLEDLEKARSFVKFLKLFYMVTLKFSGSLYVTSNSFFHELISMHTSISQLCKNRDVYVSKMANNMMTKYKIFWGYQDTQNFLLCVVVVLDPHFKLKYVRFCFRRLYDVEEVENFTMKIKDTLLRVFEYYINVEVVHSVGTSINEDVNIDLMVVDDDMLDDLASQFKKYLEEEGGVQRKNKVERYLGDDCEDPNDFKLDILG